MFYRGQNTEEETLFHNKLKKETNINNLINHYQQFLEKYPNSNYLLFTSDMTEEDDINGKILDTLYAKNSLVLWEKALPVLRFKSWYIKKIDFNRKILNRLNKINKSKDRKYFLDSISNKDKYWYLRSYKEVKTLVENFNIREEQIELEKWKSEHYAWEKVDSLKTISACKKYFKFHPNGKNINNVIELQVMLTLQGKYNSLPTMNSLSSKKATFSNVTIRNSTSYMLTVLYSGPSRKRIQIEPFRKKKFKLKNGMYQIAASVDKLNVRSFAGRQLLKYENYEAEYYIKSIRRY